MVKRRFPTGKKVFRAAKIGLLAGGLLGMQQSCSMYNEIRSQIPPTPEYAMTAFDLAEGVRRQSLDFAHLNRSLGMQYALGRSAESLEEQVDSVYQNILSVRDSLQNHVREYQPELRARADLMNELVPLENYAILSGLGSLILTLAVGGSLALQGLKEDD